LPRESRNKRENTEKEREVKRQERCICFYRERENERKDVVKREKGRRKEREE
jgi:hypothetical protein